MCRWRLRLEVDETGSRVAAALDETGEIIGLAAAVVTRDPDAPTAWELYSINVVAQQQGSGVADDLMQATAGDRDMTVWVVSDNARAQRFYDRHGFRIEGATRVHEVTGASEMRMVRRSRATDR
ncbi:MAG TPA: GNAT family N-acetyltransferase [Dermatophilaceae bacterium]|nr:GNAT family N-acetyltransferase [Dermatophilaceae bacterium]